MLAPSSPPYTINSRGSRWLQGFTPQQLFIAATGRLLPGDELAHDPKYSPQSFKSFVDEKERNEVNQERKTTYVAGAPILGSDVASVMAEWHVPDRIGKGVSVEESDLEAPLIDDMVAYLKEFFHGLPVKKYPDQLTFTRWQDKSASRAKQKKCLSAIREDPLNFVGLTSNKTSVTTRIRVRRLGSDDSSTAYSHQLNLNDILDHAIEVLPVDAYCLILLTKHDPYEDESNDFCCGRAYGGSRIAVVSSAQYQPNLDSWHGVYRDEGH